MNEAKSNITAEGLFFAFVAFIWWGVVPPLYFEQFRKVVSIWEVLGHRIVWSVLFLGGVLWFTGKLSEFIDCLKDRQTMGRLLITTVFIVINWYGYVYGVSVKQVVQTSLGYFINPLVNVVFGLLFFGERLRNWQWVAVGLATVGVAGLTWYSGRLPWIALMLAFSFGTYGMLRKSVKVNGLVSLSVEILIVSPFALGYLIFLTVTQQAMFGQTNLRIDALLILSGVITAIPLLCFGQAARKLPLTTLGFIQYLAPTLQFLTAIFLLREKLESSTLGCFCFIWTGLIIYSVDSAVNYRKSKQPPVEKETVPEDLHSEPEQVYEIKGQSDAESRLT